MYIVVVHVDGTAAACGISLGGGLTFSFKSLFINFPMMKNRKNPQKNTQLCRAALVFLIKFVHSHLLLTVVNITLVVYRFIFKDAAFIYECRPIK